MKNALDSNGSAEMGDKAETRFIVALAKHGYALNKMRRASRQEERMHIDLVVGNTKYEIKSMKRIMREEKPQDKYAWIEITNWSGHQGWLFGNADKIAFEIREGFIIVALNKLQQLVASKVKYNFVESNELKHCPDKVVYRIYKQRNQEKVELTLVPMADIIAIAEEII